MSQSTRRDFLKLAAVTSLAAANPRFLAATATPGVQAWATSPQRKLEEISVQDWRTIPKGSKPGVSIDSAKRYQEILGFGAAFTDASCYCFSQLPADKRQVLLNELFGQSGLRLSVGRTCVGASDYSRFMYSFDESPDPDPELRRFSIEHDREYILPTLVDAQKVNPDLFLFSSPWSPPGWMKSSGTMLGGSMRKKYLSAYAQYFVKFLQGYSGDGVKIKAVTIQNEVDSDQDGRMPAALWGQEYEVEFIKRHLGPALRQASLDTKIWILDHNYDLWGRVMDQLSDPEFNKFVDGVAWHAYGGTPDAMTRIHEAFPTKNTYWTEGGPDITDPEYATDWTKWSGTFAGILQNWAQCIVGWNLVLDEKGRPNIGPFPCGGLVTANSHTHEITRSGQYWAFSHYSKFVSRGARVIGSECKVAGLEQVAFENPDGSHVLVLTNKGEGQKLQCQWGTQSLDLALESGSITTLRW